MESPPKEPQTNPNALRLYCMIADLHDESPKRPDEVFVGLFRDGSYHILGCRPKNLGYLLPVPRQSQEDWAIMKLPEGVKRIEDMKRKTLFTSLYHTGIEITSKFYEVKEIPLPVNPKLKSTIK